MGAKKSEKDSSLPSTGPPSSDSDKDSTKASDPSPSSPSFSDDSDSPPSAPSKSSRPPLESPPPSKSHSPRHSPPPPPSLSAPPPPSQSPLPSTSQSPPPSKAQSPLPPPSKSSHPPSTSSPPKGLVPTTPSAPPPTPSSPPPETPTSPPPSSTPAPPPTPPQHSLPSPSHPSPPPSPSPPPPPPPTPTPPSLASPVTPPDANANPPKPSALPVVPIHHPPSPPLQPPPMSAGSHTKSSESPESSSPSKSGDGDDNTGEYIGIALAGVFIVAFVAIVVYFIFRRKQKRGVLYGAPYMPPPNNFHMKAGADVHYYVDEPGMANGSQDGFYASQHGGTVNQSQPNGQIVFSYDKIREITNGFSSENVIGEGGFGYVYKATLPDGRVGAVKQLKAGSGQGEREFRSEVEIISRVHHRHLVSLVGYCISEQQRVLIYEYVPNGTLNHHLHGSGMPVLDWPKRMKIAIGAAKGLAYLHDDCNPKIIHRDIKSANILLDNAYEAQVSDFGLARLTDDANTHVSTRVMGTFGYMAPEYATSGKLTDRSDVFSFGVVLLELVTGRKPVDPTQPLGDESLVEWARPLLLHAVETGDFGELVDPRLEQQFVDSEMFRMIEAAAACVRHSAPKRPRMVQVVRALDSVDQLCDLSNGVKYGHSTVYDSGQYNEDIMNFRRMVNGSFSDSEFDMYSRDYGSSREISGSQHSWMPYSSSGEEESKSFNIPRNNAEHRS